jgi:hypothetical protein
MLMLGRADAQAKGTKSGKPTFLTDMRRSLCCIQSQGTCRSTVHASILWLLMFASCLVNTCNVVVVNANLLTGSANQHD